jgi:epoxyqueuosine reductase
LDSRLCISYFTLELRGSIPSEHRAAIGPHVFGCDICQDVCPWNARAPFTESFEALPLEAGLEGWAYLTETEFQDQFRSSPVARARYSGFLRNVAVAMGNSGLAGFREPLEHLSRHEDPSVAEHARWALAHLEPPTEIG